MKASPNKAPVFFLSGVLFILFLTSFSIERFRPSDSILLFVPSSPNTKPLTKVAPPKTPGKFYPLTEEYLRQRGKEVPYDVAHAESVSSPRVFEPLSPLELALASGEPFVPKKAKARPILLGAKEKKDDWRPLSDKEREEEEAKLAQRAVEMGAELADSLEVPYFSESLLWTTQWFRAHQRRLAEQYRLHVDVSTEDATLSYNLRY
ncbi:MAG: hypothetical protein ABH845_03535 [Candidatus Omnitrophota bacterium]